MAVNLAMAVSAVTIRPASTINPARRMLMTHILETVVLLVPGFI